MIPDEIKKQIQGGYSGFLKSKGLKARTSQRQMIADIANYLFRRQASAESETQDDAVCVIEAGTGTGKTLAYLSAAIPVARYLEINLIISTATVTLQEQLLNKDLPAFREHSGLDFTFAIAKGRGRYLCLSRLESLMAYAADDAKPRTADLFGESETAEQDVVPAALLEKLFSDFANYIWDGEFDSLDEPLPGQIISRLTTDNRSCSGRSCEHYSNCPYYGARNQWAAADVLVCNHDLVLADLGLGGGVILPPPEQTLFIFDEAHHVADKALQHFAGSTYLQGCRQWLKQGNKALAEFSVHVTNKPGLLKATEQAQTHAEQLDQLLADGTRLFWEQIGWPESAGDEGETVIHRFEQGELNEELDHLSQQLQSAFAEYTVQIEKLYSDLKRSMANEGEGEFGSEDAEVWYPVIGTLFQRAEKACGLWALMKKTVTPAQRPIAKWVRKVVQNDLLEFEVCASPVVADSLLEKGLWNKAFGCVLTSATLSSGQNFQMFCFKNGIGDNSFFRLLESPFDYPAVSELHIPSGISDPSHGEAHTSDVIEFISGISENDLAQGGILVLFSSRRQMNDVFFGLEREWRDRILRQDDYTRSEVIRKHKEKVDSNQASILFGLASFAEGLDLPGRYLVHVIVAKIPFSVPDDPIDAALAEWVESRGGNPFMEISLPQAAIRLKQACGRLIRTEKDWGRVTLLDPRILTRRYGSYLLKSLPDFRRITD